MPAVLATANVDFHGDLVRNIPGIRRSQHLYDDLSDEPADWDVAVAAEGADRLATGAALISRPFDYGTVISYSFDTAHWQATRCSDGTRYGVWYGSTHVETTVYETAWHWWRFVTDSYAAEDREIVTERRVFDVRCDALLIDVRGREHEHPGLVDRTSYAFTQSLGRYLHEQGANGLLAPSARCSGVNAAIFRPERLSNVRDRLFLTYKLDVPRDTLVVEKTPGRRWLRIAPSGLMNTPRAAAPSGPGFTLIEMLVVMAIIAILALMAVPLYSDKFIREQVVEGVRLADIAKAPVAASWAALGKLPDDNEAAGLPVPDKVVGNYVKSVTVEAGAIHVVFGN